MKKFLPHSETQGKMKSRTPIAKQTIMYRMVSRRVILTPGVFATSGVRIGGRNGQATYASAGRDDQGLIAWEAGIGSPQQPRLGGLRDLLLQQAYFFSDVAIVDVLAVNLGKFFKGDARVPGLLVCRSEEHTSELQSRPHLVCRLLLEKKIQALSRTCSLQLLTQLLQELTTYKSRLAILTAR